MFKNKSFATVLFSIIVGCVLICSFTGCDLLFGPGKDSDVADYPELIEGEWTSGSILDAEEGEEWYKFTATSNTQYIHVENGTMTNIRLEVYTTKNTLLKEGAVNMSANDAGNGDIRYYDFVVSEGSVYYIKISPREYEWNKSQTGTYKIAFNTTETAPARSGMTNATELNSTTIATSSVTSTGEKWFKLTSNANPQYIHVRFDTLTDMTVDVYNSASVKVDTLRLYGPYADYDYDSFNTFVGEDYYLKVTPYSTSNSGSFRIAFNNSSTRPATL
jgi:hypothetical protein